MARKDSRADRIRLSGDPNQSDRVFMSNRTKLLICALIVAAIALPAALRVLHTIDPTVHFSVLEYAAQVTK